jgi:putative membrane protein
MSLMLPLAMVVAMLGIGPAAAQFGNPGGADPATVESKPGVPLASQTNVQDRLFAILAAQGGMAEVELAKLATQKSRDEGVSAFARQMLEDHGMSNRKLMQLSERMSIPLPGGLDADQKALLQELSALGQGPFEVGYMRSQIVEHQKTVQLLLWVITSGESADMQHFASETLPTVLHHLQLAQDLVAQLTGAVAP